MSPNALLFAALREPASMLGLDGAAWNQVIRAGRAERLLGSVAALASDPAIWSALPERVRGVMTDEIAITEFDQRFAAWETNRARHALSSLGIPVILLKGAAYLAAGLPAARGRRIGDLDILVPRASLDVVEAALLAHGWAQAKEDNYDDAYYRNWMHELPPFLHGERGGVIDVHHTILPLTARLKPDADRLVEHAAPLGDGLSVLSPPDMLLHAAAHLAYDGEFEGGPRNLWDVHQLVEHFSADTGFWDALREAAARHELRVPLMRTLRLANTLFGTPSPADLQGSFDFVDRLALRKLYGRNAFGRQTARLSDRLLYIRGHWLRMPPLMLARHLTRKYLARRQVQR